jgi:EAL domain-containing protein (putative c-di-GMP-specific phosphodiesterase class I)
MIRASHRPNNGQLEREDALSSMQARLVLCKTPLPLGGDIWLDHFGEEYGALSYLAELPIRSIKLDARQLSVMMTMAILHHLLTQPGHLVTGHG